MPPPIEAWNLPYSWTRQTRTEQELHLWPHQSLRPRGYAGFIGATFAMIMLPLIATLGSVVLWGVLPFLLLAVGGVWFALDRSRHNAQVSEVLTLTRDHAHLMRRNPTGQVLEWDCNRYWARPELHAKGGPVPQYVTLSGGGRQVEIGAFLSEPERVALYRELVTALKG